MGPRSELLLFLIASALCSAPCRGSQTQTPISLAGSYQIQVHFTPKEFRKPVPFELVKGHLLFKARVQGQGIWAMLDNGTKGTLIDADFAQSAGLKVGPVIGQIETATGTLERRRIATAEIEIPGQFQATTPLSAADLSFVSKVIGRPVSMIVGKEFFDNLLFVIRPSNGTFETAPSGGLNAPPNTPQLDLKNDPAQVEIAIGGKPALVTVDLGDDDVLGLSNAAWNRLGLNHRPGIEGATAGAEGHVAATRDITVDQLAIGPVTAHNVTVSMRPIDPIDGDGTIGIGFFSLFDFAIDTKARKIWLISPADVEAITDGAHRAVLLYKAGHKAEAENQLAELRGEAKSDEALNNLCWAEATAGIMLETAVAECRQAVAFSNGSAQDLDSLGMALLQSGKLDEALIVYDLAVKKGHAAGSYMGRAITYNRKGDMARAQADVSEARQRDQNIEGRFAEYGLRLRTSVRN